MKLARILSLLLTICIMLGMAQFPVLAEDLVFEASASLKEISVESKYTYSSSERSINPEEYVTYQVSLPNSPNLKLSEYYAKSLDSFQQRVYRAFIDGYTINANSLNLKQSVAIAYQKKYSINITTQQQLQNYVENKLEQEMNNFDLASFYNAVQYDHTELFWMQGIVVGIAANASAQNGTVTMDYTLAFFSDASELFASNSALRTAAKNMNTAVNNIIANVPTTSQYDVLVYFNDWLKQNNTYNHPHLSTGNYPLAHGAYSAFTSNNDEATGPVCQGYAYALKYLCDKMGYNNVVVTGDLYQTGAAPGPHAWNAVEIDGNWYAIDTTSNDSLGTDAYFFLVGSNSPTPDPGYPVFSRSHVIDDTHVYPTLSTTKYRPHSYDNACDATCNDCGAVREVPDHVYDNDCDTRCNVCNAERTVEGHTYSSSCDTTCNKCGEKRETTHTYLDNCASSCHVCGYNRAATDVKLEAIASSEPYSTNTKENAVDNSLSTAFVVYTYKPSLGTATNPEYIIFDMGAPAKVKSIEINWGTGSWGMTHPDEYKLLVSRDGINYTTLAHYENLSTITPNTENPYPAFHVTSSSYDTRKAVVTEENLSLDTIRFIKVEIIKWKGRTALTDIEVIADTTPHVFDNGCDVECNNCYANRLTEHVYDNACDDSCNECAAVREVPDHVYDNVCDADCNECSNVRETPDHTYDNSCDADCNVCGHERDAGHTYDNDKDATCNKCGEEREIHTPISSFEYQIVDGKVEITRFIGTETDVIIPSKIEGYPVTELGNAFSENNSVKSVTLPDGLEIIGSYAFFRCYSLTEMTIPDSVKSIYTMAFADCKNLKTLDLGNGVETIKSNAFSGCHALTDVTFPESLTTIEGYAFMSCRSLKTITVPDTVTTLGSSVFMHCVALEEAFIGSGIDAVPDSAFYNCNKLKSVTFTTSIKTVEGLAFQQCSSLTDVYYTGSEEDRPEISIGEANDAFVNATWHYNHTLGCAHTYDNDTDPTCNECGEERVFREFNVGETVAFGLEVDTANGIVIEDPTKTLTIGTPVILPDYVAFNVTVPAGASGKFVQIVVKDNDGKILYKETIKIAGTPRLSGDVNEDGKINNKDLALLRQFLNDWDVTVNESNADVNADDKINNKDLALLRQYLNDWDVVLK